MIPCPLCSATAGAHTFGCRLHRVMYYSPFRRARVSAVPIGDPIVINRHHYRGRRMPEPWLYIGRNDRQPHRASPLANPFTVGENGLGALDMYREHLRARIDAGDQAVLGELRRIGPGTHLVCSCAPRPCHGDVVLELWRELGRRAVDSPA